MLMFKGEEVITGRRDGTESMFLDGHAQNQLYKYGEGRRHERRFRLRGKCKRRKQRWQVDSVVSLAGFKGKFLSALAM